MNYWIAFAITIFVSCRLLGSAQLVVIFHDPEINAEFNLDEISNFFLKKKTSWSRGGKIRPIEQKLGSPAREEFRRIILRKSEIELAEYWMNHKQHSGLVQPIQVEGSEMVLQLVKSLPGSVGYLLLPEGQKKQIESVRYLVIEK